MEVKYIRGGIASSYASCPVPCPRDKREEIRRERG
jgi:hypothetical protein